MRSSLLFFICFLILTAQHAAAAKVSGSLHVFYMTGKAYLHTADEVHLPLGIGSSIAAGSAVLVEKHTEVILKDDAQSYCVIKSDGHALRYGYDEIVQLFAAQKGASVMEAMWAFISKQLDKKDVDIQLYAQDYLRQKGGVYRSGCTYPLMLSPGYMTKTGLGDISLSWASVPYDSVYVVEIYEGLDYDEAAALLYKREVQGLNILVSTAEIMVSSTEGGQGFNWVVYPASDRPNCARYYFRVMGDQEQKEVEDELAEVVAKVQEEDQKLLVKAGFYEEREMLLEAKQAYEALLAEYKDQANSELYQLFMARNGMLAYDE